MSAKGYSDQYLVADAIGKHDGVPPVAMLPVLLEAAEDFIDAYTEQTWLVSSVAAEMHTLNQWPQSTYSHYRTWAGSDSWWGLSGFGRRDAILTLNVTPVTTISAVRARWLYVGAPITTLPSTDYELVDPEMGQLMVSWTWFGQRLSIDYAVNETPVPADIRIAATKLVAYWVMPMINGGISADMGIKSYSIGQDLTVEFQDNTNMKLSAPPDVIHILDQYVNVLVGF